jgi:dsRNA-specific ribonuclease
VQSSIAITLTRIKGIEPKVSIDIQAVKKAIGITDFSQTQLLEIALTHPSRIYENIDLTQEQKALKEREYRRLAILGDAMLSAVVIDYLHQQYPALNQGTLSDLKSEVVSQKRLAEFSRELKLRQLCLLGQGVERKDYSEERLFTEMFEALLGTIYLECERDFSRFRKWLVKRFIEKTVHLLTHTQITEKQLPEDGEMTLADKQLRQMKQQADALVAEDETLQQLLTWVKQKSLAVEGSYEPAKVRAFYLALVRVLGFDFAKAFDDPTRRRSFARSFTFIFNRSRGLALNLAFDFDAKNVLLCLLALDLEPQLKQAMQELEVELPDPDKEPERFDQWRKAKGQAWVEKLTDLMGHNLQLGKQQKELLKEYYKANKSLVEYLNSGCDVTPAIREEIEEKLLLPMKLIG